MLARKCQQVVELLVAAIGLDVHPHADLSITRRHARIQVEQTLQVDRACELGGDRADVDAARSRMQNGRGGHASCERMQQELDWIGTFVVPQEHRRLTVRELESHAARLILRARTIELLDRGPIFAPVDPDVARSKLELRQRRLILDQLYGFYHLIHVQAVSYRQARHDLPSCVDLRTIIRTLSDGGQISVATLLI